MIRNPVCADGWQKPCGGSFQIYLWRFRTPETNSLQNHLHCRGSHFRSESHGQNSGAGLMTAIRPLNDDFSIEWATFQKNFVTLIRKAERFLDEAAMRQVWNSIFGILYLCYDLEKEFLSQFRENAEKLLRGLQIITGAKTTQECCRLYQQRRLYMNLKAKNDMIKSPNRKDNIWGIYMMERSGQS